MELITERLILREFVEADWEAMLAYENNPLYLRYYEWEKRTKEGAQEFIGWFTAQQSDNPRCKFHLVITLKDSDKMIGMCGVRKDSHESHKAEIGYELDPDYWGKGYGTEAARTMLNYGFTHLSAERIWAHCVADNAGSIHVLEKLGMQRDGRLRREEYYKGRYWDTLIWSILREEWEQIKAST